MYIKSPLNYTGGKFKLLNQIVPLFPKDLHTFVDLFCGGLDVSLNVSALNKLCNDKEPHIIDFYNNVQLKNGIEVHNSILDLVEYYNLNKSNVEGFLKLREDYNAANRWDMFYALISHSFNHQIRFSKKGKYNMPFGKNRSEYNKSLQERLRLFGDSLDEHYIFENKDFRKVDLSNLNENSFVYVDPPYFISTATYNECNGWSEEDERDLLSVLDRLTEQGVKWGLSNVLELNGKENNILKDWSTKYTVHRLNFNYSNSSYHKKDKSKENTVEVYICNYVN